jgi:hypothetical protein
MEISDSDANRLHNLMDGILSSGAEPVSDIAEWLSQHGYFAPSEDDMKGFIAADSMGSRIGILDCLNREARSTKHSNT